MFGPERLRIELVELGYAVEMINVGEAVFAVIEEYEVPLGQFAGRTIELAIPATPDFPRTVGASLHVRTEPQLFDYSDTLPGVRNITNSSLGPEWRYWSHNFGWNGSERSTRLLMNQIKGIFANA
ncbi:hypothetical protein [Geotalea toluenoxydans]|uniref:hypothetical protein n=1 Tax=Geotalea toluenoxydans TaxID=421624 RepID=UPI0006CF28B3|nr:hypothetical protein [Geotalea toluenoxydans]